MTRIMVANACAVFGLGSLVAAGFVLHPAAGLAVGGLLAVAVAVGLTRMERRR